MAVNQDQRICIKFCFNRDKIFSEIYKHSCKTSHDDAVGGTQMFEWCLRFRSGKASLKDFVSSWRPSSILTSENIEKVRRFVQEERWFTFNDVCNVLDLIYGMVKNVWQEI
jgi:hypothetical protein